MSITCQLSRRILVNGSGLTAQAGMPPRHSSALLASCLSKIARRGRLQKRECSDRTQLRGTNQRTQFRDHRISLVRFFDKAAVRRKLGGMYLHLPRHNEDFYGRPAVAYCVANFSPSMLPDMSMSVKQQGHIGARFEHGNRFVRVASLKGHETPLPRRLRQQASAASDHPPRSE